MKKIAKKIVAVFICMAMVVTVTQGMDFGTKTVKAGSYGLNNPRISNGLTTWDCVYFGNYYQSSGSRKEKIKWRVLSVNGNDAFLLADKCLDAGAYHDEYESITWENCTLRKWMNGSFYSNAFSSSRERQAIYNTRVRNESNPYYGTTGGNDTNDYVFLLSISEASNTSYGFDNDFMAKSKTRCAQCTNYAISKGASVSSDSEFKNNGDWRLRTPGETMSFGLRTYIAYCSKKGYGIESGGSCTMTDYAIRPALHLNLSYTDVWSNAGTVDSNNKANLVGRTVTGKYKDGSTKKVLTDQETYKDEYFTNSAIVGQGDLAKLSMLASASTYNKSYAENLMLQCGFKYKYFSSKITNKSNDKVSYIVGTKNINGTNIVAVWVKGTSANYEWVSNFNLGKKKTHSGFSKAENGMNKSVTSYLNKQGIKSNIKFWITGHSRGAAVANLYAKRLTNKYSKHNVFAYTFATPRVSKSAKKNGYENIKNYLNPGDFVTEVAPRKWNYKRYGTDITFNEKNKSVMAKSFKNLTKKNYGGFDSKGKNKLVKAFVNYGGKNVKSYYKKKTYHYKKKKKKKKMKASPADYCQKGLALYLHSDKKVQNKGMNIIKIISTQNAKAAVVTAKMYIDGGKTYKFKDAHTQAGYICWLKQSY